MMTTARRARHQLGAALLAVTLASSGCLDPEPARPATTEVGSTSQQLTGLEGTLEYASDVPWRMEPELGPGNSKSYGSIPIYTTVLDMDTLYMDVDRSDTEGLGVLCTLTVTPYVDGVKRGVARLHTAEEIELMVGYWDGHRAPTRYLCSRGGGGCDASMLTPNDTSEWHALHWYNPGALAQPGTDLVLKLEAAFQRHAADTSCDSGDPRIVLESWGKVHFGEDRLPRFGDTWAYGDLHYHSQGTDNEGESGYSYRGVVRALGALGVDFAFATEHASEGSQIVDMDLQIELDLDGDICGVHRGLRDMNGHRFDYSLAALLGRAGFGEGANNTPLTDAANGKAPMLYRSRGTYPQVFLGGEVDVVPEVADLPTGSMQTGNPAWNLEYGNNQTLNFAQSGQLCDGWENQSLQECDEDAPTGDCPAGLGEDWFVSNGEDGWVARDVQGINKTDYFGRQHVLYLPRTADTGLFVGSSTSKYGGGTRRLVGSWQHSNEGVADEIARRGGYGFLAHPLSHGGGSKGPGMLPYTDYLLAKAFDSPAILGLQLWNQDQRLKNDDPYEFGYDLQWQSEFPEPEPGFDAGRFALRPLCPSGDDLVEPCEAQKRWQWPQTAGAKYVRKIHNGVAVWDRMLRWGLQPERTAHLAWLSPGEPRRLFMAGGSDGHGDFSFRRAGYARYTTEVFDSAFAKVRNLVDALDGESGRTPDHASVVAALADGRFSVTDGPAMRIVLDANHNGIIDDSDPPMGSVNFVFGTDATILVEFLSTEEFGTLPHLDVVVGDRDATRTLESWQDTSGRYHLISDVNIDLTSFAAHSPLYVRAQGWTDWTNSGADCSQHLRDRCIPRRAFTNPIWLRSGNAVLAAAIF